MKTYRIIATVKEGIRDNQGIAVQQRLIKGLGFTNVDKVRIGKTYTVTAEDDIDTDTIVKMFVRGGVLNEVMEDYTIEELNKISPLPVSKNTTLTLLQDIHEKIRRAFAIPRSMLKK